MLHADIGNGAQLICGIDHACGVRGVIEHKALGFFGNGRLKLLCGNFEILLLTCFNNNRCAANHANHFIIADPERRRDYDLVTGVGYRSKCNVNAVLCAACDYDLRVVIINAAILLKSMGNCLSQRNYACCRSVFSFAVAYSSDTGHVDVVRSIEIGLARAKTYNVKAVGFHLLCKAVNRKSSRCSDCFRYFRYWFHYLSPP